MLDTGVVTRECVPPGGPAPAVYTVSAPRGTTVPADPYQHTAATFVLRKGLIPDKHLPTESRLGRSQYKILELYDRWRSGAVLQQGAVEYDSNDEVWVKPVGWILEDAKPPATDADKVTVLLNQALPVSGGTCIRSEHRIDARLPLEGQKEIFAQLGWDTVPTAWQLMARMVERAEEDARYYDQLVGRRRACQRGPGRRV